MAYRIVISCLWLAWVVYWVVLSWGNKRTVYRVNRVGRILFFIGTVALLDLFTHYPYFYRQPIIPRTVVTEILGVLVCACGFAVAVWARRSLGTNWSGNPTIKEGHELITKGPYRLVRHPIYSGLLLAGFGSAFANGRLRDFIIYAYAFIALWIKARIEESLMMRQFPEAYPEYRRRTKALIPGVF